MIKHQFMFVIRPRKMQEAQCLRGLFSLALVLLLDSWFVTNINAYPMQFLNPWIKSPLQVSPRSIGNWMKTRRAGSDQIIAYRLDSWSQYDNPEEGKNYEGDLYRTTSRKTITTDKTLLWPNGIVNYYVHSSITNEPIKFTILKNAFHTIMSKSCIKFVHIEDYTKLPRNNWVNITGHNKGCYSELGRNANGPTILNLDVESCFHAVGHAIHEMLHTLGVYHEHMRPDRDEYVTIMWQNMRKESEFNFHLLNNNTVTDFGLPYDYDSIMHYSMTAFSTDRSLPTIVPTKSYVEIGQRNHLSYYDIQKLLIAYNCNSASTDSTNKLKKNSNRKKFPSRKELSHQDKSIIETEEKSQMPTIIINNSISNKLNDKNADVNEEKSMDRSNQVAFLKCTNPIQSNFYPVSFSQKYPYINIHLYLHKN